MCLLKPTKYFTSLLACRCHCARLFFSHLPPPFLCVGFHLPCPCCPPQVFCGTCHHAMPWRCPSSRMPWLCWRMLWSSPTRAGTPPHIRRRTASCTYTRPRSSAMPRAVSGQCCLFLLCFPPLISCFIHHQLDNIHFFFVVNRSSITYSITL